MHQLPISISILFIVTTAITVFLFNRASHNSIATLSVLLVWLALQAIVSVTGFYTVTNVLPPRFLLLVLPPVVLIILIFILPLGRQYMDSLDIRKLTLLHTVRILVEMVLYWLYIHKTIPELMTFEGWNFDVFSGLSAPVVFYYGFIKKRIGRKGLLVWNFVSLALLINVVFIAMLSAPLPFQQLAFDQPNVALLYFPFVWLPCGVVPIVLFAHLAAIRQLIKMESLK
ncbi:MAG: hypothetical protein P4L41_01170 [Flavipsychrobacter sp.]|nr:hypothetical protein [Flavipsychrobacter sp.]